MDSHSSFAAGGVLPPATARVHVDIDECVVRAADIGRCVRTDPEHLELVHAGWADEPPCERRST